MYESIVWSWKFECHPLIKPVGPSADVKCSRGSNQKFQTAFKSKEKELQKHVLEQKVEHNGSDKKAQCGTYNIFCWINRKSWASLPPKNNHERHEPLGMPSLVMRLWTLEVCTARDPLPLPTWSGDQLSRKRSKLPPISKHIILYHISLIISYHNKSYRHIIQSYRILFSIQKSFFSLVQSKQKKLA